VKKFVAAAKVGG